MRLGFLLLVLGSLVLQGQTCVPAYILQAGQVSGQLDGTSCSLTDGTAYIAYQLVYPARGNMQASLNAGNANLTLILRDVTGAKVASGASINMPVESGMYTLRVNAAAAWVIAAGPALFTLQTSFTPEPGMLCTAFPLLGINQTMAGSLGVSGCAAPDGTPFEAYTVNTLGSGTLTVSVASTAFSPTLVLRSDQGVVVAAGTTTLSAVVPASTQYQVIVGSADTSGAYQITTSFQAAATETCVPRKMLTQSGQDAGMIVSTSCSLVLDSEGDLAYYSYYLLTVPSAGLADVAVSSGDFTPTIYLLDSADNQVAVDSGGGPNGSAEVRLQLNPGAYMVQVFSNYTSGGNYALTYNFTPGLPQPCLPQPINPGDSNSAALSVQSCRTSLGLTNLYTITLPSAGTLNLDLVTSAFMGQIAIRDSKDNLLTLNQDLEGLGDSHITAVLAAGTLTIAASAVSGAGAYQLVTAFTPNPIPACAPATQLSINGGYIQTLGASGCVGSDGQPMDAYQFTLPADGVVGAVMTSGDFSGDLTLTDSSGNLLRHDRTSYAPNDPLIVQFLKAGTYQVVAKAASSAMAGLYQVTLITTVGPRPPFCGSLAALPLGSSVMGTLGTTSCQYLDGTFADIYPVTLSNDTAVDLRLNSPAFDAYLLLLDPKGNLVAQDDDSGGGTNSRIVQQLKAGTYYVVAKPFANYYSVGAYTLSLAVYQPPPSQ